MSIEVNTFDGLTDAIKTHPVNISRSGFIDILLKEHKTLSSCK